MTRRADEDDSWDWAPVVSTTDDWQPTPPREAALATADPQDRAAAEPAWGQPELASAAPAVPAQGGLDGPDLQSNFATYLDFLSRLCRQLGIADPVEEYFAPVVGRWSELHAEAGRWRAVGAYSEVVVTELTKPLGGLDAAWQGADADSFIEYMNRVGLAGNDMSDAMIAMGEVLDLTADGLREIVTEMAGLLAEVAHNTSQAMAQPGRGEDRSRQYVDSMNRPTRQLFEAVRQILDALVRLCDGLDGSKVFEPITMAHTFPAENWAVPEVPTVTVPSSPTTSIPSSAPISSGLGSSGLGGGGLGGFGGGGSGLSGTPSTPLGPGGYVTTGEAVPSQPAGGMSGAGGAAGGGGKAGGTGGMMGGGMPMGMGGGMAGGSDSEHKRRTRVTGDPEEIFGKPTKSSPPVIGDD
ncbi:WXG100 family type VII secretion target [Actinokineospora globicatena]|uniref:WXG100 family type VII secretion target n=1 Tax=Actinokineospora globicatena TaxID=103729 RepID=UPI0020A418E1|nr:hypothetical protein [Actinokineospora globicatena]MCP2301870.1 hypothetical protein [Actinokineospora globicatena]GLW76472.1 hypothetical protein Aglo01_09540 [Actinokineospora globicatena]GLW83307.1 hypothetical protein Aglo02_09470 [Actinokineospora globicatena]